MTSRLCLQIEMLIELEEELPSMICRSMKTPLEQVEFPNIPRPLRSRVSYSMLTADLQDNVAQMYGERVRISPYFDDKHNLQKCMEQI